MQNAQVLSNSPRVTVRHVDFEQCLVWFGNVEIILSLKPPTLDFMRKIISELEALAKQCGRGTGALLVIRSDVDPPTEEARTYIRQELAKSSMLAAAQVVEGKGFRGAAMRSVLTMLQLASRAPYPMKIFDGVPIGARWLAMELRKRAGDAPDPAELERVALDVRRRFLTKSLPPPAPTDLRFASR